MFEIAVEDIFSITGRGTVFAGKILVGQISIGDPVLCKTPSREIRTRVISIEELGTRKSLQSAEAGARVGVLCKYIDHQSFSDAFSGEGENAKVIGVTLTLGKKSWWQF
jgi:translation elongation factor EF-Tu-like GTPase